MYSQYSANLVVFVPPLDEKKTVTQTKISSES